jgi:hypothetical protein
VGAAHAEKSGEEKPKPQQPMDLPFFHNAVRTSVFF